MYFAASKANRQMDKIRKTIIAEIKKALPEVKGIYLFGSYAKGQQNIESDLDIAILLFPALENIRRWKLSQHLAAILNKDVDLVDLQSASTVMQFQVITQGKRLYDADFAFCEQFEDKVYQLYLTLNDDRKFILDEIRKTGKIYG